MTLLAPNNAAMNLLGEDDDLENLLKYHAVEQRINLTDITNEDVVKSIAGETIRFNFYNNDAVSFEFLLTVWLKKPCGSSRGSGRGRRRGLWYLLETFIQILDFSNWIFNNIAFLICSSRL